VVLPAAIAPVALIGGWTLAAALQPSGYESVRDTISALAAHGATDRWVMTIGLAMLGVSHIGTAIGLVEVGRPARILIAIGGAATIAVAALPQPTAGHVPAATAGFIALTAWPFAARPRRWVIAGVVLLVLLGWLALEIRGGDLLGLSERLLAGAQSILAFVVAMTLVRGRSVSTGTLRP
jgi:hypothetical membrane protein